MARDDDELSAADRLELYGWKRRGHRWAHKNLNRSLFEWPTHDAARLTRESRDGFMDRAHRMLRGEDI